MWGSPKATKAGLGLGPSSSQWAVWSPPLSAPLFYSPPSLPRLQRAQRPKETLTLASPHRGPSRAALALPLGLGLMAPAELLRAALLTLAALAAAAALLYLRLIAGVMAAGPPPLVEGVLLGAAAGAAAVIALRKVCLPACLCVVRKRRRG